MKVSDVVKEGAAKRRGTARKNITSQNVPHFQLPRK